ncbi:hypothetical protein FOL46_005872 [Perkinsus olseni]|uniref:Uncharacterized protein n=1 Tax=Perkinsus olseni TaxID=32597 RepID=A0A7J6LPD2_PEROL|nr:hypothetical protein FOL46_005872 [Perkinsus olseni]
MSNLPFSIALRARRAAPDILCSFVNDKLNTASASFYFIVEKETMPRTSHITCPDFGDDGDQHRTFTSEFSGHPSALASYYVPGPMMEHDIQTMKLYEFKAPPPNDTGLDPLGKTIQAPPELLPSYPHSAATVWEMKLISFGDLGDKKACLATMASIKLRYHTFTAFCDAYRNVSNSAVEAARNQTWHFWDKGEEHIEVFPPLGNLEGMSEQDKFIALAHPIYH